MDRGGSLTTATAPILRRSREESASQQLRSDPGLLAIPSVEAWRPRRVVRYFGGSVLRTVKYYIIIGWATHIWICIAQGADDVLISFESIAGPGLAFDT